MYKFFLASLSCLLFLSSCTYNDNSGSVSNTEPPTTGFQILTQQESGVDFANMMTEDANWNYFDYQYIYHGGGVSVGDINNDGLPDIYFTSNQKSNKLYLNQGNLKFKDITESAGVSGTNGWTTGTSMVDANSDGYLDIYVCMSGQQKDPNTRANLLYINHGDGTFSEQAKEFGLDAKGHSIMAYFADLDNDTDLDMYLVNHRVDWKNNAMLIISDDFLPGEYETDRVFYNNGAGKFIDNTERAGIKNKAWGLGAAIGDFNQNGYNDIYVANDFLEPDFMYMNNGSGKFSERNTQHTKHISFNGMGVDWADFNNDAMPDLCVLDMTPPGHKKSKQNMASMRPDQFFSMVSVGWHHQYMVNTLQMSNGFGSFSEVAHLAGIDRTEWSWAPLFVDLDNDGNKDLFITNGIKREVGNSDFRNFLKNRAESTAESLDFDTVMKMIPTSITDNLIFRNTGDLKFEKANELWNFNHHINSSGAAFADLDADGDMDLITSNLDKPASIIRNTTNDNNKTSFIQFHLKGGNTNPFAIGSKATLYTSSGTQFQELMLGRGFQSSVEPILHFGLGTSTIDSVRIDWYDRTSTLLTDVKVNSRNTVNRINSKVQNPRVKRNQYMFLDVAAQLKLNHVHQ